MAKPPDDLSLRLGYWFAVHRDQLRTWWAISILGIDILLLGYFAVVFTAFSFSTDKVVHGMAAMAETLVPSSVRTVVAPLPLDLGKPVALPLGANRFDLVVPAKNPNTAFVAVSVRYRITLGSVTKEGTTSIWPGDASYLTAYNALVEDNNRQTPTVDIVDVRWVRPPPSVRLRDVTFSVTDASLRPVAGASGGIVWRYTATLKNTSVFTYHNVHYTVALRSGGSVVAVGDVIIDQLDSFAARPFDVTWRYTIPADAQATVLAAFNPLSSSTVF